MKKILITFLLLFVVLLLIPFVGNKFIETTIENRIEVLDSYGLKVQDSTTDSSYLSTSKRFVFVVEDTEKFVSYLNEFSDTQLPPYVNLLIDGQELVLDLIYSNIPISDALSIEIYPKSLPSILYHLNYDILNDDFNGYIKDVNESFNIKDNIQISLDLISANFSGSGLLIAPDTFSSDIKRLKLGIDNVDEVISIDISDFSSSSVFESKTTYATTLKLKKVSWNAKSIDVPKISADMKNLAFDFSSNAQSVKADFYTKTSFNELSLNTSSVTINTKKFNYDIALRGIDSILYEKLVTKISKAKASTTAELDKEIDDAMIELLGKGFALDIADFSVQDLSTIKTKNLGAVKLKAQVKMKRSDTKKISMMKNMDLDMMLVISKVLYDKLSLLSPVLSMARGFGEEIKGNLIFDVKLKDSKLSVNGRGVN